MKFSIKKKAIALACAGAFLGGMIAPVTEFVPEAAQVTVAAAEAEYSYQCTKCQWTTVDTPSNVKKIHYCSKGGDHNFKQLEKRVDTKTFKYGSGKVYFSFRPLKGMKWIDGVRFSVDAGRISNDAKTVPPRYDIYDADTGKKIASETAWNGVLSKDYYPSGLNGTQKVKTFYFLIKPGDRPKPKAKARLSGTFTVKLHNRVALIR